MSPFWQVLVEASLCKGLPPDWMIGHRPETYSDPRYVTLLENAVTWVGQGREQGCSALARR